MNHGRLARWRKWRTCDVGEAKEELENELWCWWSNKRIGECAVKVKRRKGLENELWRRWSDGKVGKWAELSTIQSAEISTIQWAELILQPFRHFTYVNSSFSNPSLASPTSQFILQPFRCFTYVRVHSPSLLSLLLRHRLFNYVTWRAAHVKS